MLNTYTKNLKTPIKTTYKKPFKNIEIYNNLKN